MRFITILILFFFFFRFTYILAPFDISNERFETFDMHASLALKVEVITDVYEINVLFIVK